MTNGKKSNVNSDMEKLKAISDKLESNMTDLDKSLQLYEEGIIIYRRLKETLSNAQRRVEVLQNNDASPSGDVSRLCEADDE